MREKLPFGYPGKESVPSWSKGQSGLGGFHHGHAHTAFFLLAPAGSSDVLCLLLPSCLLNRSLP